MPASIPERDLIAIEVEAMDAASGLETVHRIFDRGSPTAVFVPTTCSRSVSSTGSAARAARCARDVAVVGYDDVELAAMTDLPRQRSTSRATSSAPPPTSCCAAAPPEQRSFSPHLVQRESTGAGRLDDHDEPAGAVDALDALEARCPTSPTARRRDERPAVSGRRPRAAGRARAPSPRSAPRARRRRGGPEGA